MKTRMISATTNGAPRRARQGFTLIELLTVMVLISVLAAVSLPAFQGLLSGSAITRASHMTRDGLILARQAALTQGDVVEVRFYRTESGGTDGYRVIRLVRLEREPNAEPGEPLREIDIAKPMVLPEGVVISEAAAQSTLIGEPPSQGSSTLPGYSSSHDYVSFRFTRDGSTNLPVDASRKWFVTVCNEADLAAAGTDVPSNLGTVQVDPLTGRAQLYRP